MTNDPTMSMKAATSGAVGNFIALALRTQRSLCQHVETSGSNTIFAVSRTAQKEVRAFTACATGRLCEIS